MANTPHVRDGIGVFVIDASNGQFLIGTRINSHGSGTQQLPGGHLEFGETLAECAQREVLEETGLEVDYVRFLTATNNYMPADHKHYVMLFVVCSRKRESEEARNMEPHKCEGWRWVSWEDLLERFERNPSEIFLPLVNLIRQRPDVVPIIGP